MTPDMRIFRKLSNISLGEKCPNLEFFWSAFSCIRTEYGEIHWIQRDTSISPYSVGMQENMDQKNSEYGQFSRSGNIESEIEQHCTLVRQSECRYFLGANDSL